MLKNNSSLPLSEYKLGIHMDVLSKTETFDYYPILTLFVLMFLVLLFALFLANKWGNAPHAWVGALFLTILMILLNHELYCLYIQQYPSIVITVIKENEHWRCFAQSPFNLKTFFGSEGIQNINDHNINMLVVNDTLYVPTKTSIRLIDGTSALPDQLFWTEKVGSVWTQIPGLNVTAFHLEYFTLQEIVQPVPTVVEPEAFWDFNQTYYLVNILLLIRLSYQIFYLIDDNLNIPPKPTQEIPMEFIYERNNAERLGLPLPSHPLYDYLLKEMNKPSRVKYIFILLHLLCGIDQLSYDPGCNFSLQLIQIILFLIWHPKN